MAHVAQWKFKEVEELKNIIQSYSSIAIVSVENIPVTQMQKLREKIREIGVLRVSRNRLIKKALEETGEKISDLANFISGQTAILAARENPFKLYEFIKKSRTKAPAKGGEIAQHDIEVKAGETPFKPGPIVGELQKAGIPAAIEGGKVVIKKDKVLVKRGERISNEIAQVLTRLEIYPIDIGLDLKAVYEDGVIFTPDTLEIDKEKFRSDLINAIRNAFLLAISQNWISSQTINYLISKAYQDALSLSLSISFPTKENVEMLLAKAHSQAIILKNMLDKKT